MLGVLNSIWDKDHTPLSIKDARRYHMCIIQDCNIESKRLLCDECKYLFDQHFANPSTWAGTMVKDSKRRSKKSGYPHQLNTKDIYALIPHDFCCPIFQLPVDGKAGPMSATLDKIDPRLGYVVGNVRLISKLANEMKSSATKEQLKNFASWILNF